MTPSFEFWLACGLVGFYLFDSALLLYVNELVYVEDRGRWSFVCPAPGWQVLRRNPYLPSPLRPDRPLFRVCWSTSEAGEDPRERDTLPRFLDVLEPLRRLTLVLLALLLVGLPVVLLGFGAGIAFLVLLGFVYLVIVVMLMQTYRSREALGLSPKTFALLTFDCLACAPFAINLVRKISLRRSVTGDPVRFARRVFDEETFARLVSALCSRLGEALEVEDEESARHTELRGYRTRLLGMVP